MRDSEEEDPRDAIIRELQEYLREAEHALATSEQLRRVEVEHIEQVCLMERLEERRGMRERFDRLQAPMKRLQENLHVMRYRKSGGEGKRVSVRVDLGGRRIF